MRIVDATIIRGVMVEEFDTLYDMTNQLTGDPNKWMELYQYNQSTIGSDPDKLKPGQWLAIPPLWPIHKVAIIDQPPPNGYTR